DVFPQWGAVGTSVVVPDLERDRIAVRTTSARGEEEKGCGGRGRRRHHRPGARHAWGLLTHVARPFMGGSAPWWGALGPSVSCQGSTSKWLSCAWPRGGPLSGPRANNPTVAPVQCPLTAVNSWLSVRRPSAEIQEKWQFASSVTVSRSLVYPSSSTVTVDVWRVTAGSVRERSGEPPVPCTICIEPSLAFCSAHQAK